MPLWSNEDWRARIGLCWCALGRAFNTRFTRCRGKSQRYLSTHQAVTMVIMMILFISANTGLYVTRERHKNLTCVILFGETITELHLLRFGFLIGLFLPVLKFVVQMVCEQLPRKIKMSLKQFFIDLNDSLWFIGSVIRTFIVSPVLFVVNFTMANISSVLGEIPNYLTKLIGDRLSNRILMRSLVVVVVVTIQLLVSVVVARAIILPISGDVERNHGPGHIDYFVTKELLVKVETTAVQATLLLRCGDVESNPGPLTREGGVNHDVERNMNEVVKSGQITDSDRMFNNLALVIHDKFMEIGLELGLEYETLCNELEVMKKGSDKAMKMLQLWKKSITGDNFTYSVLATALEKHGLQQAAHKFCYTEAISNLQSKPQQCGETREAPTVNSGNNPPPTVASDSPTVNMPYGYHNRQSPHPSSSFMLPPPAHMPMYNQTSFSQHLNNQGNFAHLPPSSLNEDGGFESVPQPGRHLSQALLGPGPVRLSARDLQYRHPSQALLGQVRLSAHDLQYIDLQKFVDSYLAQEHSTDVWPPLKIVKFVKLSLVKQSKHVYHMNLRTIEKDIDEVYGGKSNIRYEDIFRTVDNISLVLFEGRPGSGKTTLLVRISCDWARGACLNSKLVVLVRLRHLNKTEDTCLHDILSVACPGFFTFGDRQCLSLYIERILGENVVFLLDGFDEYAPGASDDNYISKLILKKVCPRSIVILSSRPAATQRFRKKASIYIEVVGFMKEQVIRYINCYFEDDKEKSLFLAKHLEKHQDLLNLCYLPLHCAMLVFLYEVDGILPDTKTEFYRDFTLSLLIRGIYKQTDTTPRIESFDCLPDAEKDIFHKICRLAFKATVDSRQVFKEREVKEICFSDNSKERVGLVVIDRYFAKCGIDETYTFLHLTLQEYLAAVFVSRLSESEQVSTMATHFAHQRLFVTTRFLFGILDYSKESTKNLFERMLGATKDHHLHHIQCACESHSASACSDVVNFHDKSLKFERINNTLDMHHVSYSLKTGEYDDIELSFSECNFNFNDVFLLQGVGDRPTIIRLKSCDISNSGLDKALKHWPNLVKLELDHCHCRVSSVAEVFGEGLQHMTKAHHTTNQTLEITLKDCDFNKEAAVGLLQAVGDRRLSLTISHENKDTSDAHAHPLVDALCLVTLPGLIELNVSCVVHLRVRCLTMGPNNLKYSTNLQKLNQTLGITLEGCVFNKEAAVDLLQAVGDRRLSLTIRYYEYKGIDDAQPLVDALCLVTLPGLIELNVSVVSPPYEYPTMGPNNLKYSTNLQKLKLWGLDISISGLEKALKHWPNLVELELDNCHCHVTSVAEVLGEGLQHMTKAHRTTNQTLKIILENCVFNKEAALCLFQAVGDRRLSLTITLNKYKVRMIPAHPLVDALCLVTLPGLIELNVHVPGAGYPTMGPNNLKYSTNLQELKLWGLDISNLIYGVEKALKHWPNLVELNLEWCHIDASTAVVLGESLQHTSKLQTLDQTLKITLEGCVFNKKAAVGLLQAVGDRRLSLSIGYEYKGIDDAQPLVDALCLVTLPRLIELKYVNDDHKNLTMGPNNLKYSTNLQKLKLCGLDISHSGLEKALKHWPNLVELNLGWCNIAVSTAVVLGVSLQHTSKLQTLDLRGNSIGDDGLHALSLPIKNYCKALKELWLCKTQLTDKSITCLTEWIKVLNNLEKLNLTWNHFSKGGDKQIEEAVSERNTREGVAKLKLDISSQIHAYHYWT